MLVFEGGGGGGDGSREHPPLKYTLVFGGDVGGTVVVTGDGSREQPPLKTSIRARFRGFDSQAKRWWACHGCSQYVYKKIRNCGHTVCTRPAVFVVNTGGC